LDGYPAKRWRLVHLIKNPSQLKNGLLTFVSLAIFFSGCSSGGDIDLSPGPVPPAKVAVFVNGEPLALEEFDNEFRLMQIYYSAVSEGDMRSIKLRLFEQVINRRILVQEARRLGLKLTRAEAAGTFQEALKDVPDDFSLILKRRGVSEDAWKRKLLQERLVQKLVDGEVNQKVQVGSNEVKEYYWAHLGDYWLPSAVRARHLVVRTKPKLQKALDALKKGQDFSRIAETFSQDPDPSRGGDWRFMETDRLPGAYLRVLSALRPGEISKPFKDDFGYHLFQLIAWRPKRTRSLAEVQDKIHDELLKKEQDERFGWWMAVLKKKAIIKVNQDMAPIVGASLEGVRAK
jgi:parvulin-like peptidyl-prolyl isomerase